MMQVLLVEDDRDLRSTIALILEVKGFEVLQAPDGRAALDIVRDGTRPDVALVDLMMPVMDGRSLCLKLRDCTLTRSMPIVIMTARDDGEMEALGCGVSAVLRKPVPINELLTAIREAAAGQQA